MDRSTAIEQPADLTLLQNQQALDAKLEQLNNYARRQLRLQGKQIRELQAQLDQLKAAHPPFTEDEEPLDLDADDEDDDIDNPLSLSAKRANKKPRGRK